MSEENFDPQYQKGRTDVSHKNIDQPGDDHPFGDEAQSFEADLKHLMRKVADDLYDSWQATFREYLANAETACLKTQQYVDNPSQSQYTDMKVDESYQPKVQVIWNKQEDKVTITDNGIGMAAAEVDQIFRQIGHSSARDDGSKSGQFGMGALSFVKLVGLDNAMIMTSHSRLNGDNAGYYVTLAGVEPIMGSLPDEQFGTRFQMTPKDDFSIREAVKTYAEWMRVPVRYEEIDDNGTIAFQEDYGDKSLFDAYDDNRICLGMKREDAFEAYASPDFQDNTLLLSMDIDRNDGNYSSGKHGSPFGFDIRLLDESGKVIESSNGNEGLMPTPRSDYESMLKDARDPYITQGLLNNGDIIGQEITDGPNAGSLVVEDSVLTSGKPLPSKFEYLAKSDVSDSDVPGDTRVIFGPHQGKVLVSEDEWEGMDEGRAGLYVPEDELETYDVSEGTGDLQMPQPTSDRDRLQSHKTFWRYIGQSFEEQFTSKVNEIYEQLEDADYTPEAVMEMDEEEMVVNAEGF